MINEIVQPAGLYIKNLETGETHKLEHVKNIEITHEYNPDAKKYVAALNMAATFTGEINLLPSAGYEVALAVGLKCIVPNNWLKRNRYPMNRGRKKVKLNDTE